MHDTLYTLKKISNFYQFDIFYYSLLSLRPLVSLRPVKQGSVRYRTPAPITDHKQRLFAIKFLLSAAKDSRGSITVHRVADLLFNVYISNKNAASDKKMALYKEAISNRMFARKIS